MSFPWQQLCEYPLGLDDFGEHFGEHQGKDAGLVPLAHEGLLMVEGPDAIKFLQGQTTTDFLELKGNNFLQGGCCTPKGRMISSYIAYQWPDQQKILLRMHAPLVSTLKDHLHKYSVFFKVSMQDQTDNYWRLGVFSKDLEAHLNRLQIPYPKEAFAACQWEDLGVVLRWSDELVEIWLAADAQQMLKLLLEDFNGWTPTEQWQGRWLALGMGAVREATVEHFLPQMLNLQHTKGVSFTKGCYTGQEIIARLQHLGTLKRALYPFCLEGEENPKDEERPQEGMAVNSREKTTAVGEVVMSGRLTTGKVLLVAVVEKRYLGTGLFLEDGRSLVLQQLPYALEE